MTIRDTFDGDLRAVLVARRPIDGAPASLLARVERVPEDIRLAHPIAGILQRFAVPIAAVAVAGLAVLVAVVGFGREAVVNLPPGGSGVIATGFDPLIKGPGLLVRPGQSLIIVGVALFILSAAVAGGTFFSPRTSTNRGRLLVLIGLAGMAGAAGLVAFDGGLRDGSIRAAPLGYVEAPTGPLQQDLIWLSTAQPGEPTVGLFSLRNGGPLPLQIQGIVVGEAYEALNVGHWTALWIPADSPGFSAPGLDKIRPFEPVTLDPGEEVQIYAAGLAGRCAYGPSYDPTREEDRALAGLSQLGPEIQVAYSVLGLETMTVVDVGETFAEPTRNDCPPAG